MAIPVYSKQFGVWQGATSSGGSLSPPAGTKWVVKQVLAYSGNTSSVNVRFDFRHQPGGAVLLQFIWSSGVIASEIGIFTFLGAIVIENGQSFDWLSGADAGSYALDVYVGGYELTLP